MEIEIEGKYGWMVKCPTPTVFKLGGKDFTLYHTYMTGFIILISLITSQINIYSISSIYQGFFLTNYYTTLFLLVEDFLWFVFNPHFTLEKYNPQNIPWHASQPWIMNSPLHNFIGTAYLLFITWLLDEKYLFYYLVFSFTFVFGCFKIAPKYHDFYNLTHNRKNNSNNSKTISNTDRITSNNDISNTDNNKITINDHFTDESKKCNEPEKVEEKNTLLEKLKEFDHIEQKELNEDLNPIIRSEKENSQIRKRILEDSLAEKEINNLLKSD